MKLELSQPDVIFKPSLDYNIHNNFYDMVQGWIEDILYVAKLIPRVAMAPQTEQEDEEQPQQPLERNYYNVKSRNKVLVTCLFFLLEP